MSKLAILLVSFSLYFQKVFAGGYGIFLFCENSTKHCIDCVQIGFSHGKYIQVPNYHAYTVALISAVNDRRNKFALANNISHMRYTAWNHDFFWFIWSMTNDVGNAKFSCVTGNKSIRIPTQFNHEIVDFNTSFRIKTTEKSTNTIIFRLQFNQLLKKALRSDMFTELNLEEFACEYSFKPFKRHTNFLLRCIFYTNPGHSDGAPKP